MYMVPISEKKWNVHINRYDNMRVIFVEAGIVKKNIQLLIFRPPCTYCAYIRNLDESYYTNGRTIF